MFRGNCGVWGEGETSRKIGSGKRKIRTKGIDSWKRGSVLAEGVRLSLEYVNIR